MPDLVFHIGYPKTATTTLQTALFPCHREIDYQGKLIPSHRYLDPELFDLIFSLQTASALDWSGEDAIRGRIRNIVATSRRKVVVFSSENFLHPETSDIGVVAERLARAFPEAKVIITLREQVDMLYSFYRSHGAFAQYLFVMKELEGSLRLPITLRDWLEYQFRTPFKNVLGTLNYGAVVDTYVRLFGRENVMVGLFEKFRTDRAGFCVELCDFLGVARDPAVFGSSGVQNKGLDDDGFEAVVRKLRAAETRLSSAGFQFHVDHSVPEPWLSLIRDRFRDGNRRLADFTELALSEYGYAS